MKAMQLRRLSRIAADLFIFLLGLGFALLQEWQIRELIWGLWLSSLLVGYTTILVAMGGFLLGKAKLPPKIPVPRTATGRGLIALGLLAFFSMHFGIFHLVHAIFVHQFFPLTADQGWLQVPAYMAGLLPFVGMMALGERDNLKKALGEFEFGGAYANVVRMHLLIFFFAFADHVGLQAHVVFAVIYIVYFAPFTRASSRDEKSSSETPS